MTDYNSYPTLLQSSQSEYVNSESMTSNNSQMQSNSNNNIIYNSTPLIVLNSQKSDMALLQNSMINDGQTYVTIQTQPNSGGTDMNGAKLLNTPIIIQSSQSLPLQTSQYQQQQQQQQQPTTINVQQNSTQMTSLTPSQLQSLSYLMQTQMSPQFIQTANGLLQIIPQSFITTQQNQGQGQDQTLQSQIANLPTIGWSLGNFNGSNNPITLDNQLQAVQMNNINLPQLIPLQHVVQSNQNSFFTHQADDQSQLVSSIVDLNANDTNKSLNGTRKTSRRKRKPVSKLVSDSSQLSSPQLMHPTSTNEVKLEPAESSSFSGPITTIIDTNATQYDNKGRPFSFLCPDCPKKFTLNSRLSAHMRCHTGMRPFTCTVCGFSFTQKSYLIRHAAVHKEERPFNCEKCQKSYKHYGSLANHRKLHRKDDKDSSEEIAKKVSNQMDSDHSLAINNCSEFAISQSYDRTVPMMMCQEGEATVENGDHNSRNMFVHSTTTTTTTMTSLDASGNNSDNNINNNCYTTNQMSLIYPMAEISTNPVDTSTSGPVNIFFQEQPQIIQQQIQKQQSEEVDENYEEDYEDEEEEEEEGCGEDSDMVDLSSHDNHNLVSSASFGNNSEYQH